IGNESLPNIPNQYADNRLDYIFDYPVDIAKSGIIALLFGAGIPNMTTQFTDGGHLKSRALEYCQNGKISLINFNEKDSSSKKSVRDVVFYQNYPNPFSSYTYLKFDLPEYIDNESNQLITFAPLSIKVYNILGQVVGEILNEIKSAGQYEIKFHPSKFNLASGVYFIELQYGKLKKIIKLIISK
ncbi:MAG: T9SS type A sorting domain-containing protein, partial [Ignavibacteria bacterium]